MVKNKQSGGDGYVINVNEAIGGLPSYTRYSNNYRPIFMGELLQNGGDGYSMDVTNTDIGGQPIISKYTYSNTPVFKGELLQNNDPLVYDLINIQNGGKLKKNITQFHAIKEISYILLPLQLDQLIILIVRIVLHLLMELKPRKAIQLGGYAEQLQDILAPLGRNNLLVLASLLLLHHFAVESGKKNNKNELSGGANNSFIGSLSEILAPLGINSLGTSIVLLLIQQAFVNKNKNKSLVGGNPLKNLIAPLGTNAFIATGLLIIIEKLFSNKMSELKAIDNQKKILIGGKVNKKLEELFNIIAPITFNAFAKESFLKKMVDKKKNVKNKS